MSAVQTLSAQGVQVHSGMKTNKWPWRLSGVLCLEHSAEAEGLWELDWPPVFVGGAIEMDEDCSSAFLLRPVCIASPNLCMFDLWRVLIPVLSQVRWQLCSQTLPILMCYSSVKKKSSSGFMFFLLSSSSETSLPPSLVVIRLPCCLFAVAWSGSVSKQPWLFLWLSSILWPLLYDKTDTQLFQRPGSRCLRSTC